MANNIHCLIDASGSMLQQNKYQTCIAAASSLKLAEKRLADVFPGLPSFKVWCWADSMVPIRARKEKPGGKASLTVLDTWLKDTLAEEGALRAILFSDGLSTDPGIHELAESIKNKTEIVLSVVGIGADMDEQSLAMLASSGVVWTPGDLHGVLSEISGSPVIPLWGVTETGPAEAAEEEEDDEW